MTISHQKALIVLSGGQDSTTCLAWAKHLGFEIHAITFDYGQRHRREIEAAAQIGKLFGVKSHSLIQIGAILKGRSPLTNPSENLELYENHDQMEKVIGDRVELTFVPMRNALFLTLAANHAICDDIANIVTGVCEADNANYPDCREDFIKSQERTINEALGLAGETAQRRMSVLTPLIGMSKERSVMMLFRIGLREYSSLAFSHTAYDGQYPPVGKDHATILRAHGFERAGLPDPLVVRAHGEGLMELPKTANYEDAELMGRILVMVATLKDELGLIKMDATAVGGEVFQKIDGLSTGA